jgi:hypothetical protein
MSLGHAQISAARAVAGFLLLAHIVGVLFYGPQLSGLWIVYGALVVTALSAFCFLPRSQPRWLRGLVSCLAFAAMCATIAVAYQDLTLVNGADYGALIMRVLVVGMLVLMLKDARAKDVNRSGGTEV